MNRMPTADDIDTYLQDIARKFGVDWKRPIKQEEKCVFTLYPILTGLFIPSVSRLAVLSEMLDKSDIMGVVDLQKLRVIASSGEQVLKYHIKS